MEGNGTKLETPVLLSVSVTDADKIAMALAKLRVTEASLEDKRKVDALISYVILQKSKVK